MKLRTLALLSCTGMLVSCTTVYHIVPPSAQQRQPKLDDARADAKSPTNVASDASRADSDVLTIEARVGHSTLLASGDRRTYVMLELRGNKSRSDTAASTRTSLVLDTSGSMSGERITNAVNAVRGWVTRGRSDDIVSVVTFDDDARTLVPSTSLDDASRRMILSRLSGVSVGGSTCMSCGIGNGAEQLASSRDTDRVQRIVVLSDGQANSGVQTIGGFRTLADHFRRQGVSITTIGVGASYNEENLATLAFDTNGLHHFVASPADLPAVFAREAESLSATVATRTAANIKLAPGVRLLRVFERSSDRHGNAINVDLGSISEHETRTILLEVQAPPTVGNAELARVELSFRDAARGEQTTIERAFHTNVSNETQSALDPLVDMRLQRSLTAEAIGQASAMFKAGRSADAVRALEQQEAQLAHAQRRAVDHATKSGDHRAASIRSDFASQRNTVASTRSRFKTTKPSATKGRQATKAARKRMLDLAY